MSTHTSCIKRLFYLQCPTYPSTASSRSWGSSALQPSTPCPSEAVRLGVTNRHRLLNIKQRDYTHITGGNSSLIDGVCPQYVNHTNSTHVRDYGAIIIIIRGSIRGSIRGCPWSVVYNILAARPCSPKCPPTSIASLYQTYPHPPEQQKGPRPL